jgi:hypothetical protein
MQYSQQAGSMMVPTGLADALLPCLTGHTQPKQNTPIYACAQKSAASLIKADIL